QALSTAGKRLGLNDERGNVFLKYIDIILEIQPEYAVIEHVRGLYYAKFDIDLDDEITRGFPPFLKQIEGSVLYYVMKKLEKGGYSVKFNLYNSADFGSPQKRERVVILCTRTGRPLPYLKPTHSSDSKYGLKPWRTLRHAIGKLQGTEMEYMVFPESRMKYYRILQEGQNWTNLSKEDQMSALGNSYFLSGGKTGFFRKLSWDQPSPTVVTNPAMPATDLCHPTENRPLSVEEYKEIQEFPKNWKFAGNISDKYKQIGNAVPISLGKAIGETIYRDFRREVDLPIEGFKYSRYRDTNDVDFLKALNQKVLAIKEKQLEMEF
ncbi:MAG: DNA cytosine methyltransferase, partial [Bacteroidota bacterium]